MINTVKYLVLRRLSQLSLLALYFAGNYYGLKILQGNLSGSLIFETIPMSDPFAILQMFFAGAVIGADALIGGVIVFLLYSLVLGRAFCSWVCPVNMVTDLANYLRRKFSLDKDEASVKIPRRTRYVVFALSLLLSLLLGVAAFEIISPIGMFHRGVIFTLGMGWAAIVAIFLFDLFVTRHGFCGHICPLGAFYSATSKYSALKIKHNKDNCTNCMDCKVVCPENHVLHMVNKESIQVSNGECSNCGRCVDVCNHEALGFDIIKLRKN